MIKNNCSLSGIVLKPHGINGSLIIKLNKTIDPDLIDPGEFLFIEVNGTLIPFYISEIDPKENQAVVKLKFIDSQEEAKKYNGKNIYLDKASPAQITDKQINDLKTCIGFSFYDESSGINGEIAEYIENDLNPLFLIKTNDNQFFIPAHPEIILSIDYKQRKVTAALPAGLTEL